MDTGSDFLSMVSVKSVKAGEISPESTPTPIMMFRLDGVCTDEMVYVKLKGESDFATLKDLVATGKVINTSENNTRLKIALPMHGYMLTMILQNKCSREISRALLKIPQPR